MTVDVKPEPAEQTQGVAAALTRLRAGEPFATLLIDGASTRAAALEALLDQAADDDTRVLWVGNPLRSPLTLERLFLQAIGAEADLRFERNPEALTRMLARAVSQEKRLLVIVQQPETLDVDAREALGRMAPYLRDVSPAIQMLFCGTPNFVVPVVAHKPLVVTAPLLLRAEEEDPPARSGRRGVLPLLLLLLAVLVGALQFSSIALPFGPWRSTVPSAAPDPDPKPPAPALRPDQIAALRREFDTFLAERAPTIAALSPAQKDALFQEFLERQRKTKPGG